MIIRLQLQLQLLSPQALALPFSLTSFPSSSQNPNPKKTHRPKALKVNSPNATSSGPGHRFRQKILYLKTLKVNTQKALTENPDLRSTPLETVISVERCLASMGIERRALRRIFELFPHLLSADPYLDLYPVFDFLLNDVGIPYPDVRLSILRCPRLLVSGVDDKLRPALLFLRGLGFVGKDAINAQTTVLLVSSVENTLVPKLNFLKRLGFGYDEVRTLVLRLPSLLTFSIEGNYRPKVEYFLEEMNGDLGQLKGFPQYFGFSLEGRIKPRHRMLARYGLSLSLPEMLKCSDAQFNVRLLDMLTRLPKEGRSGIHADKEFCKFDSGL